MRRLHILCEGQTEEQLTKETLAPYFARADTYVSCSVITTKRTTIGGDAKGGVGRWSALQREIRGLLHDPSITVLTTLVDYYGAPSDTPGMATRTTGSPQAQVEHVEAAMAQTIDDGRFLPHLVMHETEAWVLACPEVLGELSGEQKLPERVRALTARAGGPEAINDGPDTAPSKRLRALMPGYRKTVDGPDAICLTGIDEVRRQCPHADAWFRAVDHRLGIQRAG
ncbi:DUF4276 family protein [Nocardiopsis sp. NRRL B-16309]|uniref:DUF4276 family protein n=1 Tax=Nocardiopsis sp. NRRL B-16309 TaxID=1519494 RepID=UPI0006B03475|nr:DUF4276 family protein [Nocardiopsis sp. NRRL B-16309]KOX22071.1 hypothetical protein ADL05_03265 [Nocardiopsis sp. NRRL B-16309]